MGYFGQLYKCARNAGGWGAWSATGSGMDYVAETEKCVVYRAQAHYDAAERTLSALSIATNFVNPLSSGNPSSASCYLYDFDPTFGGSAAISSPPGGYIGAAGPIAFSANAAGNYLIFPFTAPASAPETLYFWFTSSVESEVYGSNQIYHYATGNWNETLQTGTRTPAIYGGLSGGGGGGGDIGVDSFTVKDFGAALGLAQTSYSTSMYLGVAQVGRIKLSFDYTAGAEIAAYTAGNAQLSHLYISDCPDIDTNAGRPVSILQDYSADGVSMPMKLERGKTYYFFAVYNGGVESGSVRFEVVPPEIIWQVGDSASYTLLNEDVTRPVQLAAARYSVLKISFAHRGTARFYTGGTSISEYQYLECYLSESDSLDQTYGSMDEYLSYAHGDKDTGTPPDFDFTYPVFSGKTYYLFTKNRYYTGPRPAQCGTVIHIEPPEGPKWYTYMPVPESLDMAENMTDTDLYSRYFIREQKLSFRYRGSAAFAGAACSGGGTPQLRAYLCSEHGIDLDAGIPTAPVLAGMREDSAGYSFTCSVEENRIYWLYTVISEIYYAQQAQLALTVISPPERVFYISETAEYAGVESAVTYSASPGECGVCRIKLSFARRGVVRFSTENEAGTVSFLHGALGMSSQIDPHTGCPLPPLKAEAAGDAQQPGYSFTACVEPGETYWLFSRDDWLYGDAAFTVRIEPLPAGARIYVDGKERAALPYIYSRGAWHAAVPACRTAAGWRSGN